MNIKSGLREAETCFGLKKGEILKGSGRKVIEARAVFVYAAQSGDKTIQMRELAEIFGYKSCGTISAMKSAVSDRIDDYRKAVKKVYSALTTGKRRIECDTAYCESVRFVMGAK